MNRTHLLDLLDDCARLAHPGRDGMARQYVNLHFVTLCVDKIAAERCRREITAILDATPGLADDASYLEIGARLTGGDLGAAFQLIAVGKVLGLWDVVTPENFGFEGDAASRMAGGGFVLISGYHPAGASVTAEAP